MLIVERDITRDIGRQKEERMTKPLGTETTCQQIDFPSSRVERKRGTREACVRGWT